MGIVFRKGLPLEDMEFFQFHPTGLAGLGILISEAVRGEGGILRNADGERFMERYAPTIKDLAPRDIVARSMVQEVREGRGAGPNKDYVLLDVTHLGTEVLETKLPDITEFSRTYLGVEPTRRAGAGVPDLPLRDGRHPDQHRTARCCANNTDVVPGPVRRRRVRVRVRARLQPARAPTRCWTSTSSAGGPASPPPSYANATASSPLLPDEPARPWSIEMVHEPAGLHRHASGSPTSAPPCRTRWTSTPPCTAPRPP